MALDPRLIPDTPEARQAERIGELDRRLSALERTPRIQVGEGAPTQAVRDGTLYIDESTNRLYGRSNGTWKSVVLA
jgi:hypothetical protein